MSAPAYLFAPANPRTQIGTGPTRCDIGRAGDLVTLHGEAVGPDGATVSYLEYLLRHVPGVDGAPCLLPISDIDAEPAVAFEPVTMAPLPTASLTPTAPVRRRKRGV